MKRVFVGEGVSAVTFHDGVERVVQEAERAFVEVEDKLAAEVDKLFPGHFHVEDVPAKAEEPAKEPEPVKNEDPEKDEKSEDEKSESAEDDKEEAKE